MLFRFPVWGAFISRKRNSSLWSRFTKIRTTRTVFLGVHSKTTSIKVVFRGQISLNLSRKFTFDTFHAWFFVFVTPAQIYGAICISSLVFTVKELEKLPNLRIESPPKEIAELPRRGAKNWQCEPKSIRELCEETLQKIRNRVNERRILLKQFFKDYDRYTHFLFLF